MKKIFTEQIKMIYWRNKLAASTLNIAAGEQAVEEGEGGGFAVFLVILIFSVVGQIFQILGTAEGVNQSLEKALRVADFMELAELQAKDALDRVESCGGHFREESQTPEGEALRDDVNFQYVSAWQYGGPNIANDTVLHKEPLVFEDVTPSQRSYK